MPVKNLLMGVLVLLTALLPLGVSAQNELVSAINSKLIPLKTLNPDADFSDLQPLKNILKDKKVIGLGESAHGVHDFFVFKQRLLEFLVKEMNIKVLLTETDFAGTQAINEYILNGMGDANKIAAEVGGGVWGTREFAQMLQWVKSYNDTRAESLKISIYGFDMTRGGNTAKLLQRYLIETNRMTPLLGSAFDAMIKGGRLTPDDRITIKNAITQLKTIPFNRPGDDTKFYKHLVRVAEQYADFIEPAATASPNEKNDLRDKYMAENCEWLYQYTNNSKMIISSHSEHLSKKINSTGIVRAGTYLNEKFKDDYYLLGLCFNSGQLKSQPNAANPTGIYDVPAVAMPNNSDALLAQCNTPDFILDFKTASVNQVIKDYLNTTVTSYFIGSNYAAKAGTSQMYVQHKWSEGYDGIVFIKQVSAATAVK